MGRKKERVENIDIDLEFARLRYPRGTKKFYKEKIKNYRAFVEEALTTLKAKYSHESEVLHFERIQEFCMQFNIIFESEDDISSRVQKIENFCWILEGILISMDEKYPNETEESHIEKLQQFCWSIGKMFLQFDNDTSASRSTIETHAREMTDFYWFLNMTLTSMKAKHPNEMKQFHIKEMEEYLWFVDMIFNSIGNLDQSQIKKIKDYWGLDEKD